MTAEAVVAAVRKAFADVPRPSGLFIHGTCFCEECEEHNETLASHDPDNIGLAELGNPGWDPMCFANDEAFVYYLPAMVRLAFEDPYYMGQVAFHLTKPGRVELLSRAQARAVLEALWAWVEISAATPGADECLLGFEEAMQRLEAAAEGRAFQP